MNNSIPRYLNNTVCQKTVSKTILPVAEVIKVTFSQITCFCPYCKKKHYHGNAAHKIDLEYYGDRIAHCENGYCKSYLLVANEKTIRIGGNYNGKM